MDTIPYSPGQRLVAKKEFVLVCASIQQTLPSGTELEFKQANSPSGERTVLWFTALNTRLGPQQTGWIILTNARESFVPAPEHVKASAN